MLVRLFQQTTTGGTTAFQTLPGLASRKPVPNKRIRGRGPLGTTCPGYTTYCGLLKQPDKHNLATVCHESHNSLVAQGLDLVELCRDKTLSIGFRANSTFFAALFTGDHGVGAQVGGGQAEADPLINQGAQALVIAELLLRGSEAVRFSRRTNWCCFYPARYN
jgi:hypothetical protein